MMTTVLLKDPKLNKAVIDSAVQNGKLVLGLLVLRNVVMQSNIDPSLVEVRKKAKKVNFLLPMLVMSLRSLRLKEIVTSDHVMV